MYYLVPFKDCKDLKPLYFVVFLTCCSYNSVFAQLNDVILHPQQISTSDNSAILLGLRANYANPAGLGFSDKTWTFHVNGQNRYNIDIRSISAATLYSLENYAFGLQIGSYGISEFNQTQISIGGSRRVGKSSFIGVQAHYFQLQIEQLGNRNNFDISVGGIHQMENGVTISVYILNPFQGINKNDEQFGKFELSMAYEFSEKLILFVGSDKSWDNGLSLRPGFKYEAFEKTELIFSFNTRPSSFSFGLNSRLSKSIEIFLGYNNHPFLGNSISFGFDYSL